MLRYLYGSVGRVVLMFSGVVCGILILIVVYPLVAVSDRTATRNQDSGYIEYIVGMGDIFATQYGSIAPPDNPYEVLSRHRLRWDEDGFRVPAQPSEDYDVVVLGDSYAEAAGVAVPWPDVLAEVSGLAVRNLGFRGYAPQQYAHVMSRYGVQHDPAVVITGYFGGNDLSSEGKQEETFSLPEIIRELEVTLQLTSEPWKVDDSGPFQYPMMVQAGGQSHPVAFLNGYVSWLNIEQQVILDSANFRTTMEHLESIASDAPDACLVLAYFPSKAEVYMPYLAEAGDRFALIDGQAEIVLTEPDGILQTRTDPDISFEKVLDNRRNTATVLAEAAARAGYQVIDLWYAFDEAAADGEMLYYTYDTHLNQAGNDLAARVIADFLQSNCDLT